jgi:hypothetical protein
MKLSIKFLTVVLALSLTIMFTACEKGAVEKAGAKVDKAVEKTSDAVLATKKKVEESIKD